MNHKSYDLKIKDEEVQTKTYQLFETASEMYDYVEANQNSGAF
jgi:acyl carrier protein